MLLDTRYPQEMTESDKATTVERRASHETPKFFRHPKLSFASCVDSIKESIRKISGCKDVPPEAKAGPVRKIAIVGGARPLVAAQEHQQRKVTVQGGQVSM